MTDSQLKKSGLSEPEQRLLETMQIIDFGWLHEVRVESGSPTFTPAPKAVRDLKLGAGQGARPELNKADFVLKREVVELFKALREIHNGVISIECRHGLPARSRYELKGVGAN